MDSGTGDEINYYLDIGGFLFFLFSPLSSSSLSFEFRVLETRVACTLELGSVDSFTATGAFLCRTIH